MHQVTLTSNKTFQVEPGVAILDAAMKAGVSLPYSCKTGRCNSCKCKVLNGSTSTIHDETGLSAEEKANGWILNCVRTATSDLVIEVEDLGNVQLPAAKTFPCRINSIEEVSADVRRITLRLPPSANFEFIAGQYIDIIGPNGLRRSYSLANGTLNDKTLELQIKQVRGGELSNYWFNEAKENDLLRLNGPLGTFFLRNIAGLDLVFLATGTGIAPVKAMLEALCNGNSQEKPKSITVVWGARKEEDLYISLKEFLDKIHYIPTLTRPSAAWQGSQGYVQQVLLSHFDDFSNSAVYACGSETMIRDAKNSLTSAGLPTNRFYSDAFVCSAT